MEFLNTITNSWQAIESDPVQSTPGPSAHLFSFLTRSVFSILTLTEQHSPPRASTSRSVTNFSHLELSILTHVVITGLDDGYHLVMTSRSTQNDCADPKGEVR
jgi:hypothetical protein